MTIIIIFFIFVFLFIFLRLFFINEEIERTWKLEKRGFFEELLKNQINDQIKERRKRKKGSNTPKGLK
jgi:predicted Holliday junction resolvase-like endonuclease